MTRPMPIGACWCPQCNAPGNPVDEDDTRPTAASAPDPWGPSPTKEA